MMQTAALTYFFLPASSRGTVAMTLPNIITVFPSKKAMRERPSQFLKVSHTSGVIGSNCACATSFAFKWGGPSSFCPPVSLPIFQSITVILHAARPHRTKPMGEYPVLSSPGMLSSVWICAVNDLVPLSVPSLAYTITSPPRGMLFLSRPLMFMPTLSPGLAASIRLWCISTVKILPAHGVPVEWVGMKITSSPGFTRPCSTRPASTSPTPLIL
mmetsp:Transcript_14579/g.29173  ORF Transcript_14579/g.29173 Transcript_14579/m.29173 type:complete len:214 (+) Transcript_14579:225-866(+)